MLRFESLWEEFEGFEWNLRECSGLRMEEGVGACIKGRMLERRGVDFSWIGSDCSAIEDYYFYYVNRGIKGLVVFDDRLVNR